MRFLVPPLKTKIPRKGFASQCLSLEEQSCYVDLSLEQTTIVLLFWLVQSVCTPASTGKDDSFVLFYLELYYHCYQKKMKNHLAGSHQMDSNSTALLAVTVL